MDISGPALDVIDECIQPLRGSYDDDDIFVPPHSLEHRPGGGIGMLAGGVNAAEQGMGGPDNGSISSSSTDTNGNEGAGAFR